MAKDRFTRGWEGKRRRGVVIGTLRNARHDVDGEVLLHTSFDEDTHIARLDLLRDWIRLLEREYEHAYAEWAGSLQNRGRAAVAEASLGYRCLRCDDHFVATDSDAVPRFLSNYDSTELSEIVGVCPACRDLMDREDREGKRC